MWKTLEQHLHMAGSEYSVELPSGRIIRYFDVNDTGGWSGRTEQGGTRKKLYGGLAILRLEASDLPVHLHSHDEAVAQVLTYEAEARAKEMHRLMTIVPDWIPDLPIGAKVIIADRYKKA